MNDAQEKYMTMNIWLSIILFVVRWFIAGVTAEISINTAYNLFCYAGEAIGVAAILMLIYNVWIWKKINLYHMPVLAKRYEGSLIYTWNGEMGERKAHMDVKQTFLNVQISFGTDESSSVSINASIEYTHGEPYLYYLYLNTPNPNLQEISPIHYGHATFKLNDTKQLCGTYFTGRKTVGSIELKAIEK